MGISFSSHLSIQAKNERREVNLTREEKKKRCNRYFLFCEIRYGTYSGLSIYENIRFQHLKKM